jgi:hypothetical protein
LLVEDGNLMLMKTFEKYRAELAALAVSFNTQKSLLASNPALTKFVQILSFACVVRIEIGARALS